MIPGSPAAAASAVSEQRGDPGPSDLPARGPSSVPSLLKPAGLLSTGSGGGGGVGHVLHEGQGVANVECDRGWRQAKPLQQCRVSVERAVWI